MSLTYSQFVTTVANLLAVPETNPDFVQILPTAIDYAEGRIYRHFAFLRTTTVNSTGTLSPNTRSFTLPTQAGGPFEVIDRINVLSNGVRSGLTPVSRDVLDTFWPSATAQAATDVPTMFAMETDQVIVVGPPPGSSITLEVIGTITPTPLSASNTTTYLSTVYPELFVAASMIFLSGWQKNFGPQADNPAQAISWESQYQSLLEGVDQVDARQKFSSASWTSKQTEPLATNQRG